MTSEYAVVDSGGRQVARARLERIARGIAADLEKARKEPHAVVVTVYQDCK